MSTLPTPAPAGCQAGVFWRRCARCDALFPPAPGQQLCRGCHPLGPAAGCALAHPDDRSCCQGPPDAVRVLDQAGHQRHGCVHHGSVALASISNARVYPGSVAGGAVEAYRRARLLGPFAFGRVAGGRTGSGER